MVTCKQCDTGNALDSRFCRKCGAEIAPSDLAAAQAELEKLVSEGYKLFGESRTDEARLVALRALEDDPQNVSALSLKGMCHERAGELAEALSAFEKVVELKPDSALDRIKVTHLRQTLSTRLQEVPAVDRRRALVGALGAALLVVALGIGAAVWFPGRENGNSGTEQVVVRNDSKAQLEPFRSVSPNPSPSAAGGNPASSPSAAQPSTPPQASETPTTGLPPAPIRLPSQPSPTLPNVNGGESVAPFRPPGPPELSVVPESGSTPARTVPDEVEPTVDAGPGSANVSVARPPVSPGEMSIRVSEPPRGTGSTPVTNPNEAESLLRAARSEYQLGRFDRAATAFQRALRVGADPAATNQRLGQAFSRMGRREDAAAAYQKAISAYESALQRGGGDRERLQAGLEASRQALRVVQGG